jgi:hypothetical protein
VFEPLQDARPHSLELSWSQACRVPAAAAVAGAGPTLGRKRRHHRRPDRDVRAGVEKVGGRPVEARGPGHRNSHEPEGRTSSLLGDRPGELERLLWRREIVVGGERDEVTQEQRVGVRHLPNERLHKPVVRVKAAGQDDGQEVHKGVATVRTDSGTGPK